MWFIVLNLYEIYLICWFFGLYQSLLGACHYINEITVKCLPCFTHESVSAQIFRTGCSCFEELHIKVFHIFGSIILGETLFLEASSDLKYSLQCKAFCFLTIHFCMQQFSSFLLWGATFGMAMLLRLSNFDLTTYFFFFLHFQKSA